MSDITGSISDIYVYPIKSCAGLRLSTSAITPLGLASDRRWMIVDDLGRFLTQRQIPHLSWITPHLAATGVTLKAPNQDPLTLPLAGPDAPRRQVTIWKDTLMALDMGPEASRWLDDYLQVPGRRFHLVQFDPGGSRQCDPDWTGQPAAFHQFGDGFSLNVLSRASLDALNSRLTVRGLPPVDARRFRPNLVLDGVDAHDEDQWREMRIKTGHGVVCIELVKPCPRCAIPDIDPDTAIAQPELTDVLSQYRRFDQMDGAVCFGMNGVVRAAAGLTLQTGQSFDATYAF